MKCPKCNNYVEETWKMCPHCRTQLTPVTLTEEEQNNPLQVYKNKAIWSIVPGEVARHIRESEIENFDQITGIIIEEGVTAFVYVDGKRVAEMSSGAYEFTAQWEIDKILNERTGGEPSKLWKSIVNFFVGEKIGEKIKLYGDLKEATSLEEILHFVRRDSVVSIYLKLDKSFPMLFGVDESGKEYAPIKVRTQLSDIAVGVTMQLSVSDFNAFIIHYLVDKQRVTRLDIQKELKNDIEAVLRHMLASEIIDERGINDTLRAQIEGELKSLNDLLHGVSIERIVDISCDNADFERFHALAKEIYIAEREIDYMQRTQEMKNRVASFENAQKIHEARSTYELDKVLREINKDDLLDREEFRNFELMLGAQRKIAEAKSEWEVKSAMNDLKRSELLSEEEFDKLQAGILNGKIQRDSINEILMINAAVTAEQTKLDAELLLQKKASDFKRSEMINDAQTEDVISRIRYEREREAANDAMERLRKMREMQLEADNAELEMKRRDALERKEQEHTHEMDKTSMTYKHEEAMKDKDVAVEIHKADSSEREALVRAEEARAAREREEARSREENDRAASMYKDMMASMERVTLAGFAAASGKPINANAAPVDNKPTVQQEAPKREEKKEYFVLSMGNVPFTLDQVRSFVLAGLVKSDSLIRINGQDWQAGTLTELADLFAK